MNRNAKKDKEINVISTVYAVVYPTAISNPATDGPRIEAPCQTVLFQVAAFPYSSRGTICDNMDGNAADKNPLITPTKTIIEKIGRVP